MSTPSQKRHWMIAATVTVAMIVALTFVARRLAWPTKPSTETSEGGLASSRKTERTVSESIELPAATVEIMNLRTVPAVVPRYSRVLKLRGSLAIDPNRQVHLHARFPGQVVELATVRGLQSQLTDTSISGVRPLQTFDTISKGAPMVVIWSKDLGEMKSNFAESLAKLRLDQQTLDRMEPLARSGSISDRDFREQRAKVELGRIDAFTNELTLRTFQVSEEEIDGVVQAADMIHKQQKSAQHFAADWARVTVTAPISGVIVDKTVVVGDIVDSNDDLFKIADLSVLAIWLHAYDEDLPAIPEMPIPVAIRVPANPEIGELRGQIDRIGPIIDPFERMALLIGSVKNPSGQLRVNQFITGDIGIPSQEGVVEIPANALIDIGSGAVVYVQPDRSVPRFERRRVVVVERHFDVVHVRSELSAEQKEKGLREIHVDDPVVAGGVLELEDYQSQH